MPQRYSKRRTPGTRGQGTTNMHSVQKGSYANGTMVYRDRELWGVAASGLLTLSFSPGQSGLARLDQFGKMFELWRLKRATLRYATAVGTTTAGAVYIGLDFDPDDLPTTLQGVQALTPLARIPVWEEGSVGVLTDRVNKAKWMYTTNGASHPGLQFGFAASIWNTGVASAGEFWLDYEIELAGAAANQSLARSMTYTNSQTVQFITEPTGPTSLIRYGSSLAPGLFVPGPIDLASANGALISVLTSILPPLAGMSADTSTPGYAMLRGIGPLFKGVIYDLVVAASALFESGTPGFQFLIANFTMPDATLAAPALTIYGTDVLALPGIDRIARNQSPDSTTASGFPISTATYDSRFIPDRDWSDGSWNLRVPLYAFGTATGTNTAVVATIAAFIASVGATPRSLTTL